MATQTVPAGATSAFPRPDEVAPPPATAFDLRQQASRSLHNSQLRAMAALAIFEDADIYDMASCASESQYALVVTIEMLLKDIVSQAKEGMDAVDALAHIAPVEVSHG